MAKLTPEELIEAFKEMTLIEASEFRKLFEETFDVTAAAPVAVAAPGAAGGDAAAAAEEKDEFDVVLEEDRRDQGCPRNRVRPGSEGSQGTR